MPVVWNVPTNFKVALKHTANLREICAFVGNKWAKAAA
jgi:hypothetical protein